MPIIEKFDEPGLCRTGSLSSSVSAKDIEKVLGFGPNVEDDPAKVTMSWGFTVDGEQCGIWDYKGFRWSTYGPHWFFENFFPGKY